jgi:hypothetical protein
LTCDFISGLTHLVERTRDSANSHYSASGVANHHHQVGAREQHHRVVQPELYIANRILSGAPFYHRRLDIAQRLDQLIMGRLNRGTLEYVHDSAVRSPG